MKRVSLFVAVVAATLAVTSVVHAQSKDVLRLPFPYTFSGPYIEFGERVWNEGLVPGVAKVNREGGVKGRELEFYKVDTRFPDTPQWISEFRRLCADEDVFVVFGVGATKSTLAIYEDTNKCGVPVFNPSSGGHWPHKDFGQWTFRYAPMAYQVMPVLFAKVKERLGIKTIAISHTFDDEANVNNFNIHKAALQDAGIKIVVETGFRSKETNFAAQVAQIRALQPDAVDPIHQPGDAGTLVLQLRDRGVNSQIVGGTIIGGEDFWKLSKGKVLGAIGYGAYAANDPRPMVQEWVKLWRENTKRPNDAPDNFVTSYYDAVQILAKILNDAPELTREAVRDGFLKIKNLETISGTVSWPEVGDIYRPEPIIVQIKDNFILERWP